MTVYGMATYYAMNDKITGYKTKDRKHRFSYKYQDENGVDQYVSLSRFFPLSIPFMVTAAIKDSIEDLGNLLGRPCTQYRTKQNDRVLYTLSKFIICIVV